MREAAAAHGVGIVLRRPHSGRRWRARWRCRRARRQARRDMSAEGRSRARSSPLRLAGRDDRHRPDRLADRADALEPGVAGEIMGAGQRHRRRRRSRARPGSSRPRAIPAGSSSSSIDTRTRGGKCRHRAGASVSRTDRLARQDTRPARPSRRTSVTTGRSSRGCCDPLGPQPDSAQPSVAAKREPAERPPGPSAREGRSRQRATPRRQAQERQPIAAAASSANQAAIPLPKPTTSQSGSCARSASRSFSSPSRSAESRVFQ